MLKHQNICGACMLIIWRKHNIVTNPLKPKLIQIIYQNSFRTAKKTPHFTITKINWLTLFKEIIAVYSENHTKLTNTYCEQNAKLLNIRAGGIYSYHWNLEGQTTAVMKQFTFEYDFPTVETLIISVQD
jgi:hypothetical protein